MRIETDRVRASILSCYARDAIPDLAQFYRTGLIADSDLHRAVLLDSSERRVRGLEVSMGTYAGLLEQLPQDSELLATVIDQSLEYLVLDIGIGLDAAVRVVESTAPRCKELVRRLALLNERLHEEPGNGPAEPATVFMELPLDFGPADIDGRPRYELRQLLGEGSQGAVYAAADRVLSEPGRAEMVAIKITRLADSQADLQEALLEARAARRIRHENIVRVYDAGLETLKGERFCYTSFELVEGTTLERWGPEARGGAGIRRRIELVESIARAVVVAHAAGIVHRDIKPGNILLDRSGAAKLTDFGLAVPRDSPGSRPSDRGVRGSLGFRPPEQLGSRTNGRSPVIDIYALGGVLAWLLTDLVPNGDTVWGAVEFLESQPTAPRAELVEQLGRSVDSTLLKIIVRAMEPEFERRYPTAQQFADDLRSWLDRRPIAWIHRSVFSRVSLHVRRRPWVAATWLVLAVTCGGLLLWSGREASRREIEVLQERVAGKERLIEEVRTRFKLVRSVVESHRGAEPSPDWLPSVTMLESLMQPLVFTTDDEGNPIWDDRIEVVQAMLESERLDGGPPSFEERLWSSALGVWLFRAHREEESLTEIEPSLEWLDRVFGPEDPMSRMMRCVEILAEARSERLGRATANSLLDAIPQRNLPRWLRDEIEEFQANAAG